MTNHALPCYTVAHVLSVGGDLFRPPSLYRPGDRLLPTAPLLPHQALQCTLFLIRHIRREHTRQLGAQGKRGRMAYRTFYRPTGARSYAVARVDWQTGQIAELSSWPDKKSAIAELKSLFRNQTA